MNQTTEESVARELRFKKLCASTVTEKKWTDSCAETQSSPSLWPAMPHAQRTVCSAPGLHGPPAHTPAQGKPQKGNRYERGPFSPTRVKKVEFAVQTPVLFKRYAAVTSILVPCTTGRLVPGASASRTPPYRPSTPVQLGMGRPLAPSACRQEKSSVCESTWAKWDPKSALKAFDQRR